MILEHMKLPNTKGQLEYCFFYIKCPEHGPIETEGIKKVSFCTPINVLEMPKQFAFNMIYKKHKYQ